MTTPPDKPMDLAQATQRLTWLDEERRRDHAEIARLAQELAGALAILKDHAARTREATDRVAAVELTLTHLPRLEDTITAARSELPPLRDSDIRLEDEIARQGKDFRSQADQTARLWSEMNGRVEATTRNVEALAQRLHMLDSQRKEHSGRVGDVANRLDALGKAADGLAGGIKLLETQHKEHSGRVGDIANRLDALGKTADGLAGGIKLLGTQHKASTERMADVAARLDTLTKTADGIADQVKLLEARERDRVSREGAVTTQISRLESNQSQALEDVKRSVARVEALIVDIETMRQQIALAQEEEAKKSKDVVTNLAEQKEAIALVQRAVEEVVESGKLVVVRLEHLEAAAPLMAQLAHRLTATEEQLNVLQATYKSLQEVEDRHWNTDIPLILHTVEENTASTANSAAMVQELVASSQSLKESVRELQVNLVSEHSFSESLAAALRGLVEEDLQGRLAATQKQLQALRRLANAPVQTPTNEESHD